VKLLFTMDPIINFFSLNVGMSASLAGLPVIIKSEQLDIIFLQKVRMTSEQIEHLLPGFRAVANIDESQPFKPGTAIVWRETIPISDVCPVVPCRLQVASLGPYKLLNIYAPSGSNMKHERAVFFGQDVFQDFKLILKHSGCWEGISTVFWKPVILREGWDLPRRIV
jgi:exonuclease III